MAEERVEHPFPLEVLVLECHLHFLVIFFLISLIKVNKKCVRYQVSQMKSEMY